MGASFDVGDDPGLHFTRPSHRIAFPLENTFAAHVSREYNTTRFVVIETTADLLISAGQAPERNHEARGISL